ncbi:response regulator [Geothrix campi]|uniref:response regulator n=1 Tax=Geothrix campi TaxID=2966450 RepID=UPI0021499157|nr:response regulator [Geothrix sp. SG10]
MPRLLLVDDNPSIHRIAESLLAPTDVELVCVDSAAEALDRFGRGEHFDVALVDTAMPGMDGWTLLARLREMEATAHLPIALMAGVLDPVDPVRLAKAPIQGFLKKPIELRELGDRVRALLATPVATAPSTITPAAPTIAPEAPAFTAMPAPVADLARTAEMAMPQFTPEVPPVEAVEALPPLDLTSEPEPPGTEDDLLMLSAEDLWPEEGLAEAPAGSAEQPAVVTTDVHLELEELDLDSLHGLASEPLRAGPPPIAPMSPMAEPQAVAQEPLPVEAAAPVAEALAEESLSFTDLESLDELGSGIELPPLPEPARAAEPPSGLPVAGLAAAGLAAAAIPLLEKSREVHVVPAEAPPAALAPVPEPSVAAWAMPAAVPQTQLAPAAPGHADAAPGQAPLTPGQIQALLADPLLMDALVKAVVARMGDQVVREIAWEVMPELAGRLQR